jgi:hypothetical protein
MIPNAFKCSVCDENTHSSASCPCLYSPLKEGFYSGGGGGGGHSHDDEDEREDAVKRIPFYSFQSNKHSRSVQNIPKTILTHTLFQEDLA